jgi:peptidoglycan hydrolase FlgJ
MSDFVSMLPIHRAGAQVTEKTKNTADEKAIRKACQDFESLLVHQMLEQMRRTVPESGFLDGGSAGQIYHSMLNGELSKQIAQQKGIGLAPIIYRQIKSLADQDERAGENPLKSDPKVPID